MGGRLRPKPSSSSDLSSSDLSSGSDLSGPMVAKHRRKTSKRRREAPKPRRANGNVISASQSSSEESNTVASPPTRKSRANNDLPSASDLGITQQEYEDAKRAELELQARIDQIKQDKCIAKDQQHNPDGSACVICLEAWPKIPTVCISCQKIVGCHQCVRKWFQESLKNGQERKCPICRHVWSDASSFKKAFVESDPDNDPFSSESS